MIRVRLFLYILMLLLISNSYAGDPKVDEAYEKWVTFFDEHMWVIKKYEPKLYSEILAGVFNDLTNRSTKQVLLWNVTKKQEPLMDKYIVTAPLVILDEFHSREISKMDYLIRENRSECIELFTESDSIVNVIKLIPLELVDNRELLERAITSANSGFDPNIDLEKGELEYNKLIQLMTNKYGPEFELAMSRPTTIRSCKLLNEVDELVSNLAESKRENVLRYLYLPE